MNPIVQLDNISVSMNHKKIIDRMSYRFERNSCYALIGKNGSGKTTLLRTIARLITPTSGTVKVYAPRIGYAPDQYTAPAWITVYGFMKYVAQLVSIQKTVLHTEIMQKLASVELHEDSDRLCATLSRGQIKRLCIAQACLGSPELLLLDEPFSGIDTDGVRMITLLINTMLEQGTTIIHATHVLDTLRDIPVDLKSV